MKSSILLILFYFGVSPPIISFSGAVSATKDSTVQVEAGVVDSPQSQSYWEEKLIQLLKEHNTLQDDDVEKVEINILSAFRKALEGLQHATRLLERLIQRNPSSSSQPGVNSSEGRPHDNLPKVPDEHSSSKECPPPIPNNSLTLFDAIRLDNLKGVGRHVRCGDFANEVDSDGYALIHHATSWNSSKVLKYLVEQAGADVSSKSQPGQETALHIAVRKNYKSIVEYLVEKGADVNAQNFMGISPLHLAVDGGGGGVSEYDSPVVKVRVYRSANVNNLSGEREKNIVFGAVVRQCDRSHIAQFLIENGADVNAKSNSGDTPLHFAVKAGCDLEVVEYLVEHGAEVNTSNKEGYTALDLADSEVGGGDVYKYLVAIGGTAGAITSFPSTTGEGVTTTITMDYDNLTLVDAIIMGDLEAVRYRVRVVGDNVQGALGWYGNNATHIAAAADTRLQVLQYLVEEAGLPVDSTNTYGHTPLHLAASYAQMETIKWLLEKGENVSAQSTGGTSILHRAALSRSLEAVKLLVDNGADINVTNRNGESVLHYAAFTNHLPVVKFLVENGPVDVSLASKGGSTPLHYACNRNEELEDGNMDIEVVQYLVGKGADPKARNSYGRTPLHWAAQRYRFKTIQLLIQNGAEVNAKDDGNNTPLHLMAENSFMFHEGAMKILVENGADLDARNGDNKTPHGLSYSASPANEYLYDPAIPRRKQ